MSNFQKGLEYFQRGIYEEALSYFEYLSRKEPSNDRNWLYLGQTYYYLSRYPEAAQAFDRYLKLDPQGKDMLRAWVEEQKNKQQAEEKRANQQREKEERELYALKQNLIELAIPYSMGSTSGISQFYGSGYTVPSSLSALGVEVSYARLFLDNIYLSGSIVSLQQEPFSVSNTSITNNWTVNALGFYAGARWKFFSLENKKHIGILPKSIHSFLSLNTGYLTLSGATVVSQTNLEPSSINTSLSGSTIPLELEFGSTAMYAPWFGVGGSLGYRLAKFNGVNRSNSSAGSGILKNSDGSNAVLDLGGLYIKASISFLFDDFKNF